MSRREISIHTEYIRLDAFLKLASLAQTGGEAKGLIQQGRVTVDGEPCSQRGKKLRQGAVVSLDGEEAVVAAFSREDGV